MCPLCSGVDTITQMCLITCHLHCLGQLQPTNTVILGPADRFCCQLWYRMLLQTLGGISSGVCPDKTRLLHETWNVCSGKRQNLFSTKSIFIFVPKHNNEHCSTKAFFFSSFAEINDAGQKHTKYTVICWLYLHVFMFFFPETSVIHVANLQ